MTLRSYSEKEIRLAFDENEPVFRLDSGNSGEDDVLIGEREESLRDLLAYHELAELPDGWELTEISREEFDAQF